MGLLNRAAQKFLRGYGDDLPAVATAAALARERVEALVRDLGVFVHVISGRAKSPHSLRAKLRIKGYRRPTREVTDIIGVRVITYYRDDVDRVAAKLKDEFEIDLSRSDDKRQILGLRGFGYRSVHLIARFKKLLPLRDGERLLLDRWFEIQIRSILEHAWAEIEHEVVYKAGTTYTDETLRRFAAIAGSLELLDGEFLALREARNPLIDKYRQRYVRKTDPNKLFDVARLLGFLEAVRPEGRSWRQAERENAPFTPSLDTSCVDALKAVGLGTATSLRSWMGSHRFRYALRSFASSQGIAPSFVSHLALVVLAVGTKQPKTIQAHFPEMLYDPTISILLEKRASSPRRPI